MNKAQLIRQSERVLKRSERYKKNRDDEPEFKLRITYILSKDTPSAHDRAIVFATDTERDFRFHPFEDAASEKIMDLWTYDFDNDLFGLLEDGYSLAFMTMEAHSAVWSDITEIPLDELEHPQGLQQYLHYCKQNGITKAQLEKEEHYSGMDVMTLYQKSAVKSAAHKPPKDYER